MDYLGPILCSNLDDIKKDVLNKNWDFVAIISGYEGTGKTNLAAAIGLYLSPQSYSNKYIGMYDDEVDKLIKIVIPGDTAHIDEATEVLHAKEGMTKAVRKREKKITQMRGKNCFVLICISDLKMLDRYIRTFRALALFWLNKRGEVWIYDLRRVKIKEVIEGFEDRTPVRPGFIDWVKPLCPLSHKIRCDVCTKKPCYNQLWKNYSLRKYKFMHKDETKTEAQRKLENKIKKMLDGSLTINQIAEAYNVNYYTARKYIKKFVPKKQIFKDFSDVTRITKKGLFILSKKWLKFKRRPL